MSDPVLERSVLERKERDELMTIARALGVKPPARAKKADVVDLILTSTGITSAPAAEAQAPDPEPEPEPAPEVDAELAPAAAAPGRGQRSERTERPDRSARPRPAARTDDASVDEPVDGPDANATANVSASSNGNANGNGNDRERDDQDQDEFGNRRRRRRGRDRERGGNEFRDRPDDAWTGEPVACAGLLDLRDEGYGFLRTKGFLPSKDDVYVSVKQVRQFGLRKGDHVSGASRPANRNEKNPALLRIDEVNAKHPDTARLRPRFEDLTPLFPDERLRLETPGRDTGDMTGRIVDLVAPIGKGQRGLIVSPPKAGKTTVVKQIVQAIERNNPEVHLIVLLVDERPEEVTDMRRSTNGEVVAATFDRPPEEHIALAELTIERAKRLVEDGLDVVIVLDGITRLARAYNLGAPTTGRVMSGGIDTGALYPPKKFFGAARNVEEGGSLTILATALVDTGSKMDEVIFEEFKGTGNMELRLDRRLAERRIYPAIDVDGSSTRHEELLFDRKQLQQAWKIRRALHALSGDAGSPAAALERLLDGMKQYKTNDEFLEASSKA
jgi:transcription termination factor Rho